MGLILRKEWNNVDHAESSNDVKKENSHMIYISVDKKKLANGFLTMCHYIYPISKPPNWDRGKKSKGLCRMSLIILADLNAFAVFAIGYINQICQTQWEKDHYILLDISHEMTTCNKRVKQNSFRRCIR